MLPIHQISDEQCISDIVAEDYRAAAVFRKYGIEYCCGGKIPLEKVCLLRGLDLQEIKKDLNLAIQPVPVSTTARFRDWDLHFLMDYIIHIHHEYLRAALPVLEEVVKEFAGKHQAKYPWLPELQAVTESLAREMPVHLEHEEKIIFPYIRQMEYAYINHETYAGLLVRTLRKPVEEVMKQNEETTGKSLTRLRALTGNYEPPPQACISHRVVFSLLRELDYDLSRHLYLENEILFPRAVTMEKELLLQKN
jgi:regulator of cell morphogenesis and NO signaling